MESILSNHMPSSGIPDAPVTTEARENSQSDPFTIHILMLHVHFALDHIT
jgi:hypothetical protein